MGGSYERIENSSKVRVTLIARLTCLIRSYCVYNVREIEHGGQFIMPSYLLVSGQNEGRRQRAQLLSDFEVLMCARDRADLSLFPAWLYFFRAADNADKDANANENGVINGVNRHLQSALSPLLQHSKAATERAERMEKELERSMARTEENRQNIDNLSDKMDALTENMTAILTSLRSIEQGAVTHK